MSSSGKPSRTSCLCVPDANTLIDSRGKLHIVYQIRIRSGSFHRTVSKKYSEFRLFDRIWRLMYSSINVKLPPKIWIGNKTDKVITDRKMGLTRYLNGLVVLETLSTSLSKFLGVPEEILEDIREEVQSLGPCCDKYGAAGCNYMDQIGEKLPAAAAGTGSLKSSVELNPSRSHYSNEMPSAAARPISPSPTIPSSRLTSQQIEPNERLPHLRCVRRFEARTPGQMSLFIGEVVQELKTANGWYYGRNSQGQEGYFPSDHVQKI